MAWIKHYASKLAYLLWLTPSGQVAHATLDRRLCRTRIFIVAAVACAGVAAVGNVINQAMNYNVEKRKYNQIQQNGTKKSSDEQLNNASNNVPRKYQSFTNYVEVNSIVISAVAAAACAPLAVGGGEIVTAVFGKQPSVFRFIAEGAFGANVSMLQISAEYIIPIFEP